MTLCSVSFCPDVKKTTGQPISSGKCLSSAFKRPACRGAGRPPTKSPAHRPGESQIQLRNLIANVQARANLDVTRILDRKTPECLPPTVGSRERMSSAHLEANPLLATDALKPGRSQKISATFRSTPNRSNRALRCEFKAV